ncbi:hypothetical protein D3C81_375530 [compost metagenome]
MTSYQVFLKSLGFIIFFLLLVWFLTSTFGEKFATWFIIIVAMGMVLPNSGLLISKLNSVLSVK